MARAAASASRVCISRAWVVGGGRGNVSAGVRVHWSGRCVRGRLRKNRTVTGTATEVLCGLGGSDAREADVGVAEAGELHAHAVHQRKMQAAEFAVFVAGIEVVEHAAGREGAA